MKTMGIIAAFVLFAGSLPVVAATHGHGGKQAAAQQTVLKESGTRSIAEGYSIAWEFDKKPRLGTVILKVRVFDRAKKQVQDVSVTGELYMPSMRHAHPSPPRGFVLNKKGDYLSPFDVVMRGEWELSLDIRRGGTVLFQGVIPFEV
jgi:hypothetical protein